MASRAFSTTRIVLGGSILFAVLALFLARPGIALAHHVDLSQTTTCDTYTIEADYIGGDGSRYAEVWVNGALTTTIAFPLGTEGADNFYVLSGPLPIHVTVEVRMYRAQPGPDALEDIDLVTVNADATCTTSPTPSSTNTPPATATATPPPSETATPSDSSTAEPSQTSTQEPSATATVVVQGSITPLPSTTNTPSSATNTPPASTSTPEATATPAEQVEETPTLVTTVEALAPPPSPDEPGTVGAPPQETASGLPSTGSGAEGLRGALTGFAATLLAGLGLAVIASGIRRAGTIS